MLKPNYVEEQYRRGVRSLETSKRNELHNNYKRGRSYDGTRDMRINISESDPISSLITQVKRKRNSPSFKERCFSLSPEREKLLPPKKRTYLKKKTLVLDLDETLVHSGFNSFNPSDIILKVNFDNKLHIIHVLVRPGVGKFLEKMSKCYEIVIFTASLAKYADPLINILDPNRYCLHRLFRDSCTFMNGTFVKDLKRLNRDLKDVILVDNSPMSYAFNLDNGFPVKSWYNDKNDKELYAVSYVLEFMAKVNDVRIYLPQMVENHELLYHKATKVIAAYAQTNQVLDKLNEKPDTEENNESNKRVKPNKQLSKDMSIDIKTSYYANYFNFSTKYNKRNKDSKTGKSINIFRNPKGSFVTCVESKTLNNTKSVSFKSDKKKNAFLTHNSEDKHKKENKYSSLLDIKDNSQLTLINKGSNRTIKQKVDGMGLNNKKKDNYHSQSPSMKKVGLQSVEPYSFPSNRGKLIRLNSYNNVYSFNSSLTPKKYDIPKGTFALTKNNSNVTSGNFLTKTPKITFNKKKSEPLDDILMKKRLSSTTKSNKLKPSSTLNNLYQGKSLFKMS